jgi:SNF2 family DNA or RNA helicase
MLNILEDMAIYRNWSYTRYALLFYRPSLSAPSLDGSTDLSTRVENISNFQKEDSDAFLFLLSTRAGANCVTSHRINP